MDGKNSGSARWLGVLLIACGAVGIFLWVPVSLMGALLNMNSAQGAEQAVDAVNVWIVAALVLGLAGSVLSTLLGADALKNGPSPGGKQLVMVILALVFCLPGCVVLVLLQGAGVYIPVILAGLAPQSIYLCRLLRSRGPQDK